MLEEQVAALGERMSAVEAGVSKSNELLAQILATLRNAPPSEPVTIEGEAEPVKVKAVSKKPAKPDNSNEPEETPETVEEFAEETEAASYDLDDVRAAFLKAKETVGKETAIGAITDITGPIKNIGHVPSDKFADVVAALSELVQQEAA